MEKICREEKVCFIEKIVINLLFPGPRTPPPEHEPSTSEHSHDGMLDDEEQEILDIVRGFFKDCFHETNQDVQLDRLAWLKERILRIQDDLDEMIRTQGGGDLELVDSTGKDFLSKIL